MRVFVLILAIAGLFLAGCSQSSSSSQPAATNSAAATNDGVLAAPVDYIGAVGNARNYSIKQIDLAQLNQAIQQFNAVNGRYPKDLQELIPNYVAKIPDVPAGYRITYDATSGKVEVVSQP